MVDMNRNKTINRVSRAILFLVFFSFAFGVFSVEIKDPDFWWHLKTGQYIYEHHGLPKTDPFAYTSLSKDPIHPESKRIKFILSQYWFAQLIFYWIYHMSGFQGIILLRAALLTALLLLLYKCLRREGTGFYSSLLLLLPVIAILRSFTGERPQLFSFVFSFLIIFLLDGFRRAATLAGNSPLEKGDKGVYEEHPEEETKEQPPTSPLLRGNQFQQVSESYYISQRVSVSGIFYLLPLPFIMLLWANTHGGFILGMIIVLGYLCTEALKYTSKRFGSALPGNEMRILAGAGIVSIVAPLVNPNGYSVLPVLLEFERSPYKGMIVESMSPVLLFRSGFHEIYMILYFLLLSFSLLVMLANIKKIDLTDGVITVGLAAMSLSSSRYIPFFSPVAVIIIVRYGSRLLAGFSRTEILAALKDKIDLSLSVILTITLIIVINNSDLFRSGIRANNYPEGAVKFLKENRIRGNMFNPYTWGGYLMWTLYPDYKVFVDGRGLIGEVFFQEVKVMEAYQENLAGLPEWKSILNAYNVDSIITYSIGNFTGRLVPLIPALIQAPEWHLVYFDNISMIFVKDSAQNSEIIRRFDLPKEWVWNEVAVEAALKAQDHRNNINYLITEGDALSQKQSYADAKTAYLKALEIDPKSKPVQRRLDFIKSRGF